MVSALKFVLEATWDDDGRNATQTAYIVGPTGCSLLIISSTLFWEFSQMLLAFSVSSLAIVTSECVRTLQLGHLFFDTKTQRCKVSGAGLSVTAIENRGPGVRVRTRVPQQSHDGSADDKTNCNGDA